MIGAAGAALAAMLGSLTPTGTAARAVAPSNTAPPTVTGTAEQGQTLTGKRGTWSGTDPITYTYSWRRCDQDGGSCSAISGATELTYVLKPVDNGNTLRFRVTARNADGAATSTSVPTAVVKAAPQPPTPAPTGCGKGPSVGDFAPPARLLIDQIQISPSAIGRSVGTVTVRAHVTSTCGGPVQGAMVYGTAVPYGQFAIPNETVTASDGWASIEFQRLRGFPVTPRQRLLVMFLRARKPGENLLVGISTRRLVSFRVSPR
ncbi:MAG TPA: hypothetical protein VH572_07095 [Gaiella sp.]